VAAWRSLMPASASGSVQAAPRPMVVVFSRPTKGGREGSRFWKTNRYMPRRSVAQPGDFAVEIPVKLRYTAADASALPKLRCVAQCAAGRASRKQVSAHRRDGLAQ